MTKRSTKRALALSFVSLLLCVSMFVGTTFAWFTDSVSSTNNIITAGNLDVELEYYNGTEWKAVGEKTNVFEENTLWEPGHTEVVYLKVSNVGTLALKYQLAVNVASETVGINVDDEVFKLSDYIYFGVVETADEKFYENREDAIDALKTVKKLNAGYSKSSELKEKGDVEYVALVVYMPTTVGNEANYKTGTNAPVINLGINLFATQYTHEEDSFGSDYDKDAAWTGAVNTAWYDASKTEFTLVTAEDLAGLAELVNGGNTFAGKTVKLGANVDLNNLNWTPIGTGSNKFQGTFIGTGYTISNLRVEGEKALGLFGKTFTGAHIEGVTIDKAYVSGYDYVGAVLGQGYLGHNCIVNCTVTNATIIATPYFDTAKGVYDGGAKAGVIAGQAYNGNITGCVAKNSTVSAYRDLGGIAGMLDFDGKAGTTVTASGNTVENVGLNYVGVAGTYDDGKTFNQNMGAVVGRVGKNAIVKDDDNTVTNVTMYEANKDATQINNLAELIAFAKLVNSGKTFKGETVVLGADIDLANMEWTPIGNSASNFQGTFDGQEHIISNLNVNMPGKSNVGLFGMTTDGAVMNLTVENATVSGYLAVGVVAGQPYTSKYTNITVKGHVEVNGFAYVGGVGGRNAYANWTNITVNVDDTSYVKAISTEDGLAYRTYVGGVVGFNGEGGHTFKNITSNIDVIGDVCDIGGAFGIAHYNNKFENITVTGNVTNLISAENDGEDAATDVLETGLIAGVWHNQNDTTVYFKNISATGKIFTPNVTPAEDFHNRGLVGKKYSASGTGTLEIVNFYEKDGITYYTDVLTGDNVLYSVPAEYTGSTVNVAEGTTAIGGYAFAYNSNVETIVLPSTVKTLNDRAFRDTSASKVVLNEGLTNISYQAFRNASNVTEVVIPSTVTTISKEAFQNSGVKTLTIPANVTTLEYGACRDMKMLETVTIEGNVDIPVYAFRACTNLKTVNITGVNVTFGAGSRGMIFTNKENGDGSAITVNVANDEIKARLLAADTAAKDYGGYTIVCKNAVGADGNYTDSNGNTYNYATDNTTLSDAISGGADTVYLSSGTYTFPSSNLKAGQALICQPGTVFDGKTGLNINGATVVGATFTNDNDYLVNSTTINGTFKDCVFTDCDGLRYCYAGETVVFENCVFDTDFYGVHFDGGANDVVFKNCTFTGFNTFGSAVTKLTMEDCTFKYNGKGGYNGINLWGNSELTNCTFVFDGSASEWVDLMGSNITCTFTGCVISDGTTERDLVVTDVGDYGTGNTITIN